MKEFKTEELIEWIYTMQLQNTNGRETPEEMFRLGIEATISEMKELKLLNMHFIVGQSETTEQLKCCNVDCQEPTEGKSVYCSFHKSM
jgi:hypothetical protein